MGRSYSHQTNKPRALFVVVRRLVGGAYIVIVAAVCLAVRWHSFSPQQMLVLAELVCSRGDFTKVVTYWLCENTGPILDRVNTNYRVGGPRVEEHPTGDQQPVSNVLKKCRRKAASVPKALQHWWRQPGAGHWFVARTVPQFEKPKKQQGRLPPVR